MFVLLLIVLVLVGGAVWVVLNRPVTRSVEESDRMAGLLLPMCAVALAIGVAYGLHAL